MNGKADLSGATFTGNVTTQNLNVQGSMTGATGYFTSITTNYLKTAAEVDTGYLTVSGTGSFGSIQSTYEVSVGTNLNVVGSYGAWAQAPLYGTSYGTGNQSATWGALTTSRGITHTTNTNSFQVSQAGFYFVTCYVYVSTITAGAFQLIGRFSNNGSTWSNVMVSTGQGAYLQGSTLSMQGMCIMSANSYADILIYNATTGTVTLTAVVPNSYFYMYRIG